MGGFPSFLLSMSGYQSGQQAHVTLKKLQMVFFQVFPISQAVTWDHVIDISNTCKLPRCSMGWEWLTPCQCWSPPCLVISDMFVPRGGRGRQSHLHLWVGTPCMAQRAPLPLEISLRAHEPTQPLSTVSGRIWGNTTGVGVQELWLLRSNPSQLHRHMTWSSFSEVQSMCFKPNESCASLSDFARG